ncbi:uncharacterized protein si:ch211-13c6.2 isoform X2 [Pseudoliparis swirei]|uniref:uncharacterized protein si:ch211-13c6.2 isoform X2 n=1 Tax=Pseudoliparis swirei TaxID=2059687 RepID=UPI0024BDEF2A|nr:uncharacterized protein si:ch211-13c6.2 isoform X2 [Pseudoliparis swirei]
MDTFETPYELEAAFIECTVCDKSIRGDTLYKIHLTTPGHRKKEEAYVASGFSVRHPRIPQFEDILHYLGYMKLDEPIIGLNYLEELPCDDPQAGPNYLCKLCHQNANLSGMVNHVIGRKHRQKYVELKRPDLVTWDKQSILIHGGKIVRARAEIIERQDGRGTPVLMAKMGIEGQFNLSRVPSRPNQNRDQNHLQSLTQRNVPSLLPDREDYRGDYSHPGRYPPGPPDTAPLHPEDTYMLDRDRPTYQQEDTLRHGCREEELHRADYRENPMNRREYMDPDYRTNYEEQYAEDPQRRARPEPGGDSRFGLRQEMPRGQAQHGEYYPEEATPRKPYPEKDPLKEFYTEEVRRRGRVSSEYSPSQPVDLTSDEQRCSLNWESGRRESMNGAGRQGPTHPEANRRSFTTSMESDQAPDGLLFNFVRDYRHEMRKAYQEETVANPWQSRTGTPSSQRQVEATRAISDIPEPFRRFLKGDANEAGYGKRKRKSRFSDATAEETETMKEMFSHEYGPPNPKFGGRPRPVHETQHPDLYTESKGLRHTESYKREGSESRGVFDILNNIEIENAEQADFLKNKLCDLLKDFKTNKSETAVNSHERVAISKNYNSFNPDPELSPRHQYDTTHREDSDLRRPQDFFKNNHRGRGWRQHEQAPDEQRNEYLHSGSGEPGHSNRRRYEEVFGLPRMQHASHPDEPARNAGRFDEPKRPLNYPHAAEDFMDSRSSASPLGMEQRHGMERARRYSNNLDKITSTLLELVARK